ncbi:MAG: glycoside hydrolase family 95 protein [Bacteroidales bacterium]|nr:glycoside hydrolase family 95 protein [Bacteroidales bacterium]
MVAFATIQAADWKYYFETPAAIWEESVPLGNGRIGMMPWGGVEWERVVLNEISLWSGQKQDADNPDAHQYLGEIRRLLFDGKNDEAQALMYKTFTCNGKGSAGGSYGAYQVFGNLFLDFQYPDSTAQVSNYHRELNLSEAVATTTFQKGSVHYRREYFTSFTNDVGMIKLSADKKKAISFMLSLQRDEKYKVERDGDMLVIHGQLSGDGVSDNGMKYYGAVKVKLKGGHIEYKNNTMVVEKTNEAEILISLATNYFQPDPKSFALALLNKAETQHYQKIKKEHVAEFGKMFNRVNLSLPQNANSTLPIDKRLEAFVSDSTDADLAALYFQNGRYLLISSTREGSLPPNLQGLWAPQINTSWNGDYHLNINLQMNLWPAEVGNLSELQLPLVDYVKSLVTPGENTAKVYYNSRGWVTHILGNVWGFTSPSENPSWGATNTAGAWLCQHLWEHYQFSMDEKYLASVYPLMKGAAQFFSGMLVEDPRNGYLVTAPTTSPENSYMLNGNSVSVCAGSTMDNQIVRELFTNTMAAATLLGKDNDLIQELKAKCDKLAPTSIGKYGQIMEWMEDYEEADVHHRHVSQLYGLFPGNELTYDKTPGLMQAAKTTLERRGDESTGWSMAWKINFWARLKDGNRAYKLIHDLLKPAGTGRGTYPNLFSAHPPMQIDGDFGGTSGIAEMLIQSHAGYIELLPALPDDWKSGRFDGLKVRGGGEVSARWENGELKKLTLKATAANRFCLKVPDKWDKNKLKQMKLRNFVVSEDKIFFNLKEKEKVIFNIE